MKQSSPALSRTATLLALTVAMTTSLMALPAVAAECSVALGKLKLETELASTARDALTTTRRQAQDFKNLLLRGSSPAAYKTMSGRFDAQALTYEKLVARLVELSGKAGHSAEAVAKISSERVSMTGKYREAISIFDPRDSASLFVADGKSKGIDVATFRLLEGLVAEADRQLDGAQTKASSVCK